MATPRTVVRRDTHPRTPTVPRALVAVVLLVAAGTAGCGDDPGARGVAATPATPVAPAPATTGASAEPGGASAFDVTTPDGAYGAWLAALADRDAVAACARHAPEFTIALRQEAILRDRAELGDPCTGFAALLWEDPARETDPTSVEVTLQTSEDAVVAAGFPGGDRTVTLERRDGAWFVLTDVPRAGTGAAAGAATARWRDAWCTLEVGMGVEDLVAAMGEPSGTYTVRDGGEPQLYWAQAPYDFRAYLDADPPLGRVLDLVGDYDALSAADRAALPCPELR